MLCLLNYLLRVHLLLTLLLLLPFFHLFIFQARHCGVFIHLVRCSFSIPIRYLKQSTQNLKLELYEVTLITLLSPNTVPHVWIKVGILPSMCMKYDISLILNDEQIRWALPWQFIETTLTILAIVCVIIQLTICGTYCPAKWKNDGGNDIYMRTELTDIRKKNPPSVSLSPDLPESQKGI